MSQTFNPCIWEAEAGRSLSSWPTWFTELSTRTARDTGRNPVRKKQTKNFLKTKKLLNWYLPKL